MNKLDVHPPTFTLSPVTHSEPSTRPSALPNNEQGKDLERSQRLDVVPAHRLIVLFPASETDTPDLEQRIWEIARSLHLNVLFLSVTNDFDEESQLRRKLITMAAVIKDPFVSTNIVIEHGSDWMKHVRKIWHEGDVVACYAGQKVGIIRKSLDQVLRSSLKTPIYILSNYQPIKKPKSTFISRALFWLGSITIIAGFFWAEVTIVQMPQDWAHTALIYVCLVMEAALLWLWNLLLT